jgi:membrane protein YdbS with pleckstrin-like domain
MNRSKDLDTIAPDDDVIVSTPDPKPTKNGQPKIEDNTTDLGNMESNFNQQVYNILGHSKSPFSSFLVNPKFLKFTEQDTNETIYLAVRPHSVNNISWVLIAIIMALAPLYFKYFTFLNFFPIQYQFSAILFWYILTFIFAFEKFLDWYFDLFLVTDQRVIDISFNNLLNKHFAEADISRIQDVSSSVRGVFGTFFNFGDVLIQTASEINQINFERVSNPEKIIKLIKEIRDVKKQEEKEEEIQ